jgi:hypothetical protein
MRIHRVQFHFLEHYRQTEKRNVRYLGNTEFGGLGPHYLGYSHRPLVVIRTSFRTGRYRVCCIVSRDIRVGRSYNESKHA